KLQNGWMTLNQIPAELQKNMVTLNKVGMVSDPVRTSDGFLIVKIADIKEAKVQPFFDVKNKVKETFTRQDAEEKFAALKEKLANLTYEHPDSLQPAVE